MGFTWFRLVPFAPPGSESGSGSGSGEVGYSVDIAAKCGHRAGEVAAAGLDNAFADPLADQRRWGEVRRVTTTSKHAVVPTVVALVLSGPAGRLRGCRLRSGGDLFAPVSSRSGRASLTAFLDRDRSDDGSAITS